METKGSLSDCDSDSSDGLPELCPKHTFDITKLIKNDVVWTEYKGLYWPALIRKVDKKSKKVKVWYLDSPGKCFKVPFKKIHDFVDSDFHKKVEDDAKLHPMSKKHAEVLRRTNLFIFRRFQGIEDNPLEFFDLSKPYFLLKDFDPKISKIKSNSKVISNEKVGDKNNLKESLEDENLVESDVESFTNTKCLPELYEENSPYDDEMVDRILSYITSGYVDNYLIDIVNSTISNERHELYVEAAKKGEMQLFLQSQPSLPIKNQKLHKASIYLHSLYNQKIKKRQTRLNEYIVSVWLPEAVNKAVSLIEAGSMKLADDSCGNKISNIPTEVEITELLINSGSNNVPSLGLQVEPSESPVDSSSSNIIFVPKRKLNLLSSLVKNHNSNELESEACGSSKKKFTLKKKQKRSSKTKKLREKTPQKRVKPQEEN